MNIETREISLAKLFPNEGQIPGLKKNPRTLDEVSFQKLKKSLQDDPEMLDIRELVVYPLEDDHYVVIGGNMRLRAGEDIGLTRMPCKILPKNFPIKKMEAILVKDNVAFGSWDFEELYNSWNIPELAEWGLNIAFPEEEEEKEPTLPMPTTTIKLEYTLQDYERVKNYLELIDSSPEQAVWKLCGFDK